MKPFLQRIAREIAGRFGDNPASICVVLPNRRAGLYLRQYLAAELRKTAWSPQMFSIEDFITGISGYQIIDPAGLLFELYRIHKEIEGNKAQDFELFADWGQVLLRDFDEIDQYLADPEKVFTFLNEARALSVWNLGEKPLTDREKEYIRFYQAFRDYYSGLRKALLEKKFVYQGLAYRLAAEHIEELSKDFPWKKIFFAGLNAMAFAEEQVIDYLVKSGRAEVFWDADEYYIRNDSQEAGKFIREHLRKWPSDPVKWIDRELRESEKKIHIYGIPKGTGQAIKASQIIGSFGLGDGTPDRTALVLADESLLLPVLYSLPEETGPVNVTMGFPFRHTSLYQLVYLLFQLQENAERYSAKNQESQWKFYSKDILKILGHPYLFLWFETSKKQDDPDLVSDLIRMKNRVFLEDYEIKNISEFHNENFKALMSLIFSRWDSPAIAITRLLQVLESLRDRISERHLAKVADHTADLEYFYHLSRMIRRCNTLMEDYPFIGNLKALRKIIFQLLDTSRLPFYGEPLKGLQVMGVLETRAIDFENLVVLSVNEGIFPSGRTPNTFIPFDIKQVFGLPTFLQKDAVFAYHFYRMIQRARTIHLLYDTEGDMMKGGEKSRFIMQILHELRKYNDQVTIHEDLLSPHPPKTGNAMAISIPKGPIIMQALGDKAAKGFSPSGLNIFIRCPLQFYFQEVLGITESEEIEETIEAKTMGSAIHEALYRIYQPFNGKNVDPASLAEQLKNSENYLKSSFREQYGEGDLEHGKNHLIFKVSLFLINHLVRSEIERLNNEDVPGQTLKVLHLEKFLDAHISCKSGGNEVKVRMKGKADRIDQWKSTVRVIDYKTGSVRQEELKVKSWEALQQDPKMAKAFQLMVYAWLYHRNFKVDDGNLLSGNITLRKISEDVIKVRLPGDMPLGKESMDIFEKLLADVLEQIFSPDVAFNQTEEPEHCIYCPFRSICCR